MSATKDNFDLATDPIPSFAALVQERSRIYERNKNLDSFRRTVSALGASGEEGRRRGLGQWLVGDFEAAIATLAQCKDDDVAAFTHQRVP
ncbi:MAG: hypothetical protein R3F17_14815 [Planctomycetota bacterium]